MKKILKSDYIRIKYKDEIFANSAGLLLSMSSFTWQLHIEKLKKQEKIVKITKNIDKSWIRQEKTPIKLGIL